MRLELPVCPECGKKVGFIKAWFLKKEGEYHCPYCGAFSNVFLDASTPILGAGSVLISVVVFLALRLTTGGIPFYGIFLIALPYLLFFILAAFLIRLRKPGVRKRPQPPIPPPSASSVPPPQRNSRSSDGSHHIRRQ